MIAHWNQKSHENDSFLSEIEKHQLRLQNSVPKLVVSISKHHTAALQAFPVLDMQAAPVLVIFTWIDFVMVFLHMIGPANDV